MPEHESELHDVVRAQSRALVGHDAHRLKGMLADEFSYTNADGQVLSRAEYIENNVEAPAIKWMAQEISDLRALTFGDMGVASFKVHDRVESDGTPFEGVFRCLFVYIWRDGRWQSVAAQSVRVKNAAIKW